MAVCLINNALDASLQIIFTITSRDDNADEWLMVLQIDYS